MVSQRSFPSKIPAVLGLLGLLVALPGCPLSPDEDKGGGGGDTRLTERDTVQGAIQRFADIWEQKNYTEYELLLHEGYQFFIRDDDASEFPWLTGESWGRTTELQFAQNMFDPNFAGTNPPVESIEYQTLNVLGTRETTDQDGTPVTEVQVDAVIQVLTGPNDGFRSDTRFFFDVAADPLNPGLFQIKRQQEVLKL